MRFPYNPVPKLLKVFSRKEKMLFFSTLIILVTSGLVLGTLFIKNRAYTIPVAGGTYREGIVGQPSFINPIIPTTETDRALSRIVFASLAEMAESIKHSEDGKIWNVRLKENVLWHDGNKLTADDVVFTVDIIHDPESRSPLRASFEGVEAKRVSELEVEFTLQNTYAFFEEDHLRSLRPIPKHIFAEIPVINFKISPFGLGPIGSGPYQVVNYEKDQRGFIETFQFKANQKYFEKPPYITKLIVKFYKEDPDLVSAYNLGQIDGFGVGTAEPITEHTILIRYQPHYLNSSRYYAIFINPGLAPEAVRDEEIRKALSGTVRRERIIEGVLDYRGLPLYGPTTLNSDPAETYDVEKLKDLELKVVVPDEPFLIKTAEAIKQDWELVGARVTLEVRSLRDIQEEVLRNTNYPFILFGNVVKESGDLFAFWHSSKRFFPDQNLALYQNSGVDSLLEEYRRTFDPDIRKSILTEISDRIAQDIPAIFLYSPQYVYITNPSLGGFDDTKIINTGDDRFADITQWFVKSRISFSPPVESGDD